MDKLATDINDWFDFMFPDRREQRKLPDYDALPYAMFMALALRLSGHDAQPRIALAHFNGTGFSSVASRQIPGVCIKVPGSRQSLLLDAWGNQGEDAILRAGGQRHLRRKSLPADFTPRISQWKKPKKTLEEYVQWHLEEDHEEAYEQAPRDPSRELIRQAMPLFERVLLARPTDNEKVLAFGRGVPALEAVVLARATPAVEPGRRTPRL